mgnify:CR=1 FL=1
MNKMQQFTGLYPLSKTLRFELKPIGKTLENIQAHGLLEQDNHRAESYVKVKEIIDRYHKALIERVLGELKLNEDNEGNKNNLLNDYYDHYMCASKDETQLKKFGDVQKTLRKVIADSFKKDEQFKRVDKKELIREDLVAFVTDDEEKIPHDLYHSHNPQGYFPFSDIRFPPAFPIPHRVSAHKDDDIGQRHSHPSRRF